ncbi:MAG: molybdopterin-binding protein [Planctomycetota bacterium]|jgi:nicotinamide-nucleotide amidase
MKRASIISIGNEVLGGQTVDTNAAYLGEKLLSIGIPVVSSYTVGDDIDSVVRSFNLAGVDADLVIATGGLGPTNDDLTRQALAELLGTELQLQNELLQTIQNFSSAVIGKCLQRIKFRHIYQPARKLLRTILARHQALWPK